MKWAGGASAICGISYLFDSDRVAVSGSPVAPVVGREMPHNGPVGSGPAAVRVRHPAYFANGPRSPESIPSPDRMRLHTGARRAKRFD